MIIRLTRDFTAPDGVVIPAGTVGTVLQTFPNPPDDCHADAFQIEFEGH